MNKPTKTRRANILCHENMQPYKLIIKEGGQETIIPVQNTGLRNVILTAMELYDVASTHIKITQVFDGE